MNPNLPMHRRVLGAMLGAAAWPDQARDALAQAMLQVGRRFDDVSTRSGMPQGEAEILGVAGGLGGIVAFEAETGSPKCGKLIWRSMVRGGRLDAMALMRRDDGKLSVGNWVAAEASR